MEQCLVIRRCVFSKKPFLEENENDLMNLVRDRGGIILVLYGISEMQNANQPHVQLIGISFNLKYGKQSKGHGELTIFKKQQPPVFHEKIPYTNWVLYHSIGVFAQQSDSIKDFGQ